MSNMNCFPKRKCSIGANQSSIKMGIEDTKLQAELFKSLENHKLSSFTTLLNEDVNLEHKCPRENSTLLMVACQDEARVDFVKALLDKGANPNTANKDGLTAIHHAASQSNYAALKLLLKNKKTNVNALDLKGWNALHYCTDSSWEILNKDNHLKCISLIMKHPEFAVNRPDKHGQTPLTLALLRYYTDRIKVMLEDGRDKLNVDWSRSFYGKPIRDVINTKFPDLTSLLPPCKMEDIYCTDRYTRLMAALQHQDLEMFRQLLRDYDGNMYVDPNYWYDDPYYCTCIELACRLPGYHKFVSTLLEAGADPNTVNRIDGMPLIHQATETGNYGALKVLLNTGNIKLNVSDSLKNTPLHLAAQSEINGDKELENILRCVVLLLDYKGTPNELASQVSVEEDAKGCRAKKPVIDIDAQDWIGDTALHEAAYFGNSNIVLTLLRRGANMMQRNVYGEPPLAYIDARTLRMFFDEQLDSNGLSPQSSDYEIIMKYNSLMPYSTGDDNTLVSEMDPMKYISESEDLRPLLKHPLITGFLYLKWRCVRSYFLGNVFAYIIFVAFLTTYAILINVSQPTLENGNFSCVLINPTIPPSNVSVTNATMLYKVNGTGPPQCNHTDGENCTSDKLLSTPEENKIFDDRTNCTKLSKIEDPFEEDCIISLLRCFLFFYLIFIVFREILQMLIKKTQYFTMGENILEVCLIFGTAIIISSPFLTNDCKTHISAIVIILAWSELILITGRLPMLSIQLEMLKKVSLTFSRFMAWYSLLLIAFAFSFYILFKGSKPFYTNPALSILKSVLMMAGEFEASNIEFETVPGTSHILFLLFVFLITIILLNLLNGLAVYDTQAIKEDAAILSLQSLVRIVSYIDDILLRIAKTFKSIYRDYLKDVIRPKVELFDHSLCKKQVHVFTYSGEVKFLLDSETTDRFRKYKMNREVLRRAVDIVANRGEVSEIHGLKQTLLEVKTKVDNMEVLMNRIYEAVIRK